MKAIFLDILGYFRTFVNYIICEISQIIIFWFGQRQEKRTSDLSVSWQLQLLYYCV